MARRKPTDQVPRPKGASRQPDQQSRRIWFWLTALGVSVVLAAVLFRHWHDGGEGQEARSNSVEPAKNESPVAAAGAEAAGRLTAAARTASSSPTNAAPLPSLEINQAVMVTVELDFGETVPPVADALRDIERRYQPDDGVGRTFAILDAYGGPTTDARKLHLSMHVSTEKPGIGTLVFRRTGEILWQNRIVATTNGSSFTGKNLMIYVDAGDNRMLTVDGSANPATLLDANIKEAGIPLRDWWNDGDSREVIFIYSACGCPVKVMCRRTGDRLVRTSENPVIFPDDPAAVAVINRLMQW